MYITITTSSSFIVPSFQPKKLYKCRCNLFVQCVRNYRLLSIHNCNILAMWESHKIIKLQSYVLGSIPEFSDAILTSCRALTPGMQFQHKLHIIYLINDLVHHCARKQSHDLKKAIQDVVVPIFVHTHLEESPESQQKLTKVLSIWESNNLFEGSYIMVSWFTLFFKAIDIVHNCS